MRRPDSRPIDWTKALIALSTLALAFASDAHAQKLRMATLAPQGTVWDKALRTMGERWAKETAGRVKLTVLPGSSYGDEHALLTRVRSGQLQGVATSAIGLYELDPAFDIFGIPLFLRSEAELKAVLTELRPQLEAKFAEKKLVLLHWGYAGWVHLYSKAPIRTLDDLRRQRLYLSAGDDAAVQRWKQHGFQPQPMSADQIPLGLQTGLLDVVPTTPLLMLSMQLYNQAKYMQDIPVAPFMGAVLLSEAAWNGISPADREAIRAAALDTERFLEREVPGQDSGSIDALKAKGMVVVELTTEQRKPWYALAEEFAQAASKTIPKAIYDGAVAAIAKVRAAPGAGG